MRGNSERGIINVLGYGWTGSSAVVDLLREFDRVAAIKREFRIIKDPDGIIDLEIALTRSWQALNAHVAIRRFRRLIRDYGRNRSWFDRISFLEYEKVFGEELYRLAEEYIDELVPKRWNGSTFLTDVHRGPISWFTKRVIRKLVGGRTGTGKIYFPPPPRDFDGTTRKFLSNLFSPFFVGGNDRLVLDQSLPVCDGYRYLKYFNNGKIIVVSRDPRDVYCYTAANTWMPQDVDGFVQWYKVHMELSRESANRENPEDVLRLRFEDIVMDYENMVDRIRDFVGIPSQRHIHKRGYFDPDRSIKNVGIWKKYAKQGEMERIAIRLSEYIHI